MASYREVYNDEVTKLFGNLNQRKQFATEREDAPRQAGQPATFVPFSFNFSGFFDENDTTSGIIYIPDEMVKIVKARIVLSFKEFFAPATTVSSGGGSTSGSGGAISSDAESVHSHNWGDPTFGGTGGKTLNEFEDGQGNQFDLATVSDATLTTSGTTPHSHTISTHTHTTPAHSHDLSYGVFKETFPASIDAVLKLYSWDGAAWVLEHTETGLTGEVEDIDLSDHITVPGKYRISVDSAAGQPNSGRLGVDAAGHVVGAIQALRN